jgi:hypothetical protein
MQSNGRYQVTATLLGKAPAAQIAAMCAGIDRHSIASLKMNIQPAKLCCLNAIIATENLAALPEPFRECCNSCGSGFIRE